MKKLLKNNLKVIVAFIIGAILFGGIGYVVATGIASSSVDYTTTENQNVATVEDALDDLYEKAATAPEACYNGVCGKLTYRYWNNNFSSTHYTSAQVPTGTGLNGTYQTRAQLATAFDNTYTGTYPYDRHFSDNPLYIRSVLIDGNVIGHEPCLWLNNREFCISPNYWSGTIGTADATVGTNTKIKLQRDMQNALSLEGTNISFSCTSNESRATCNVSIFRCDASSYGSVFCDSEVNDRDCYVGSSGTAYCYK